MLTSKTPRPSRPCLPQVVIEGEKHGNTEADSLFDTEDRLSICYKLSQQPI